MFAHTTANNLPNGQTILGPWYVGNVPAVIHWHTWSVLNPHNSFQVLFTTDQQGTNGITGPTYFTNSGAATFDICPVLGPWAWIYAFNNGAAASSLAYYIGAIPVWSPQGLLGNADTGSSWPGMLLWTQQQAIAAGATVAFTPTAFVPGKAMISVNGAGSICQVFLKMLAGPNVNQSIAGVAIGTNDARWKTQEIVLPNDNYQVNIRNDSAAAGTFSVYLTTER